jgi:hypothetical protein
LYVSNYSIEDYPDHPIGEAKICKPCAGQMEMAYFFRKLCRENKVILRREYLPKISLQGSKLIRLINMEQEKIHFWGSK